MEDIDGPSLPSPGQKTSPQDRPGTPKSWQRVLTNKEHNIVCIFPPALEFKQERDSSVGV